MKRFFSLGASTAAFAALGLLTGFPIGTYLRSQEPMTTRDWLIPFFGGCVLFAWLGGGDFPTDVAGHLWSFIYGLALSHHRVLDFALHENLETTPGRAARVKLNNYHWSLGTSSNLLNDEDYYRYIGCISL